MMRKSPLALLAFLCFASSLLAQPEFTVSIGPTCVNSFPANLCAQVSGPKACQYFWSTGATTKCNIVSTPGEYCVTVVSCAGDTAFVCDTICSRPALAISPKSVTLCAGNCVILSAFPGTAGVSYDWGVAYGTSQTIAVCPSTTTEYTVTVTNANGCSRVMSRTVKVVDCPTADGCDNVLSPKVADAEGFDFEEVMPENATDERGAAPTIEVAPNPTSGRFSLDCSALGARVREAVLLNSTGAVTQVLRVSPDGSASENDASSLPPGLYFVRVNGAHFVKLVLQ